MISYQKTHKQLYWIILKKDINKKEYRNPRGINKNILMMKTQMIRRISYPKTNKKKRK